MEGGWAMTDVTDSLEYYIQLSHNNGAEKILFPVLPEELNVKKKGRGETYSIVGFGEVQAIHSRELAEISFESFFPATRATYMSIDPVLWQRPTNYINLINKWQEARFPSRITIKAPNFTLTLPVSIEQFDRREVAGSGDIEFQLTVKEYVFHSAKKIKATTDAAGNTTLTPEAPQRPDERVPPTSYTLKAGDNLWKVAQLQLGDGSRWKEIQKLNNLTEADLKKLQPGQVLKLPERK